MSHRFAALYSCSQSDWLCSGIFFSLPALCYTHTCPPVSLSLHLLTFGGEQMEIVARAVKPEAAKEMGFL